MSCTTCTFVFFTVALKATAQLTVGLQMDFERMCNKIRYGVSNTYIVSEVPNGYMKINIEIAWYLSIQVRKKNPNWIPVGGQSAIGVTSFQFSANQAFSPTVRVVKPCNFNIFIHIAMQDLINEEFYIYFYHNFFENSVIVQSYSVCQACVSPVFCLLFPG